MSRRAPVAAVLLALFAGAAAPAAAAQEIQHETSALNVEVPVRVTKGSRFVDGLGAGDFEILEDGRPQKIEAFYVVKKTIIERHEESRDFAPRTVRHFFLIFELGDADAKILEALEYFVKTVLLPGDNLTLVTPMKTYRMKGELFSLVGRDKTYDQVVGLLRRDIEIGYSESREILAEMTDLARVIASDVRSRDTVAAMASANLLDPVAAPPPVDSAFQAASIEVQLMHYSTLLDRLGNLRVMDQNKLLGFAEHLRDLEGQKGVFFFYQREFVPKIDPRLVDQLSAKYSQRPEITQSLETIFGLEKRDVTINVDVVTKAYADASAAVHFLHIARPTERPAGIRMEEQSEDVFAPFQEMARATGGFAASTANIAAAMREAVEASENYYLLYYTPAGYKADGRFRHITVKVKAGGAKVSHRLGYIAD
jgi:VWFA-related protein